jgi:hypothetical protein
VNSEKLCTSVGSFTGAEAKPTNAVIEVATPVIVDAARALFDVDAG